MHVCASTAGVSSIIMQVVCRAGTFLMLIEYLSDWRDSLNEMDHNICLQIFKVSFKHSKFLNVLFYRLGNDRYVQV